MKIRTKILVLVSAVLTTAVLACAFYVNDFYRADTKAIAAFSPSEPVERQMLTKNSFVYTAVRQVDGHHALVYAPDEPRVGLIFYPGGKVEFTAYEPLMKACAANGIFCALMEMPFNLAVLDVDAAEDVRYYYPEIEYWYIGGHSLGGSMAAAHLADNLDRYEGLVLLGSYSTADLSDSELNILSVYGSEDKVLNHEKYNEYKENLPDDLTEVVLEGGCHAYFGMYGAQDGDGTPTISNVEQIELAAEAITDLILT